MRVAGFIAVVLLVISSHTQGVDPNYNYDDFYRQYGRTYTGE